MENKFNDHELSPETQILILGTFHPEVRRIGDFFYSETGNFLWKILPACFGEDDLRRLVAPSAFIEPLILISILYIALENIFVTKLRPSRIAVVFLFGLAHGMGFASALSQLGLPQHSYLLSLAMFNVGLELGQITIILAAYFLIGKWFGNKPYYRTRFVIPLSVIIACIAAYWTVQRLFLN